MPLKAAESFLDLTHKIHEGRTGDDLRVPAQRSRSIRSYVSTMCAPGSGLPFVSWSRPINDDCA